MYVYSSCEPITRDLRSDKEKRGEFIWINKRTKGKKRTIPSIAKLLRHQSLFLLMENDPRHAVSQDFTQMIVMVMKLTVMKKM